MNTRTTTADMKRRSEVFGTLMGGTTLPFERLPLTWKLNGKPMQGIPAHFERTVRREILDANLFRTTYTGKCACGLTITVTATEYRDYPVVEWQASFANTGESDTPILSDMMLGGTLTGDFRYLHWGNGDTCRDDGYEWFENPLNEGVFTMAPTDGTSCNGAFPYMKLVFDDCICRCAVGWSAMWKVEAERADGGVRFACGQLRCHMKIHPGESMRVPGLTLMLTAGGEDRSRNLWRRWYIDHIMPKENGAPLKPTLVLHLFEAEGKPEFTGATEENQVHAFREYVRRGLMPDIWWLDAGWYKCDYHWPHIGTWAPDAERFPNGLTPIGDICREHDTRFLLWFEPERCVPGTELHDEHHDWLLQKDSEEDGHHGNHLLNLGNPEACDWMIRRVDAIIKKSGVRVYRQDFNFDPKPYWMAAEGEDRIGAVENLHVQGYLRYWDALIERNPGLWIDSCAGGGRRNDLDTMRRAVPLHYTDVGYGAHTIKQKQHRQMFEWIPYFRAHNMAWDRDVVELNGETWVENDAFSFYNAMVPSMTCMTRYDAPDEEMERSVRMTSIWRRAAELTLRGDYEPLTECRKSTEDWYAHRFEDRDRGDGFVQFIRNNAAPADSLTVPFAIDGKAAHFTNGETGETFTRTTEELQDGLTVTLSKRSSIVLFYEIEK